MGVTTLEGLRLPLAQPGAVQPQKTPEPTPQPVPASPPVEETPPDDGTPRWNDSLGYGIFWDGPATYHVQQHALFTQGHVFVRFEDGWGPNGKETKP